MVQWLVIEALSHVKITLYVGGVLTHPPIRKKSNVSMDFFRDPLPPLTENVHGNMILFSGRTPFYHGTQFFSFKVLIFYKLGNTSLCHKSDVTTASVLTTTMTATTGTETELEWEYKYCSSSSPCSLGEGDCDNDNECREGLVCGTDNCQDYSQHAHGDADCCIQGTNCQKMLQLDMKKTIDDDIDNFFKS